MPEVTVQIQVLVDGQETWRAERPVLPDDNHFDLIGAFSEEMLNEAVGVAMDTVRNMETAETEE